MLAQLGNALGQLLQLLDKIHWIYLAFAVELAAGSGGVIVADGGREVISLGKQELSVFLISF